MKVHGDTWVLVLAAGDGRRLHSLTTTAQGIAVPKQYCSLQGDQSLLEETLQRAHAVATSERVCVVVAEQHRRWWGRALSSLPDLNIFVQPENRGTAVGILLSLLHILERDPDARIVILPSDHHVRKEGILLRALSEAARQLEAGESDLLLLGIEPEEADSELGYIMPGFAAGGRTFQVASFVEKPDTLLAQQLIDNGALWNAFIVAAEGRALLQMLNRKYADIVLEMREAVKQCLSPTADWDVLGDLYARLPVLDFSRDIVEGQEANLQVLAVPPCGWSDVGTPRHVMEVLSQDRHNECSLPQAAAGHDTLYLGEEPLTTSRQTEGALLKRFSRYRETYVRLRQTFGYSSAPMGSGRPS